MKKRVFAIVLVVVICSSLFNTAFAAESKTVCYRASKIQDLNVLLERAYNHINDAPQELVDNIVNSSKVCIDGNDQSVQPMITTELLESTTGLNGNTDTYAATLITDYSLETNADGVQTLAASSYTKTENVTTKGSLVRLYTTIYYTTGTYNKIDFIKLTKVSATSKLIDSTCKVKYTKVRGAYRGYNLDNNKLILKDVVSSWTQVAGFKASRTITCPRIETTSGGIYYEIWGEGYCYITRGTQSWTLSHKVIEADVGIP